jgi:hypothetical protein
MGTKFTIGRFVKSFAQCFKAKANIQNPPSVSERRATPPNQIVQFAFSLIRRRGRSWLNGVFLTAAIWRTAVCAPDAVWQVMCPLLGVRLQKEVRRNKMRGQETQEYKTSLSEEDLKNLAGGLVLAEYLAIPAALIVNDRNGWAGELSARHRERRTRIDTGQSEQMRPAFGWLRQALRAGVALSSAAAFCAIVSQLFVLLAHVVEAHF